HPGEDRPGPDGGEVGVVPGHSPESGEDLPAAGGVEAGAAAERVEERGGVVPVADEEMAGHADAVEGHADAPADLHRQHRLRERRSGPSACRRRAPRRRPTAYLLTAAAWAMASSKLVLAARSFR